MGNKKLYRLEDEKITKEGHTMFKEDIVKELNLYRDSSKKLKDKIDEWHNAVVQGMINGLTHTIWDGRRDDINWVRKRLALWEAFGRCVYALRTGNDYQYDEKDLFEIAREGYKKD